MDRKSMGQSLKAIESLASDKTEGWAKKMLWLSMAAFFFTAASSAEKFVQAYRDSVDRQWPLKPSGTVEGEVFQVGEEEPETFRGRFQRNYEAVTGQKEA